MKARNASGVGFALPRPAFYPPQEMLANELPGSDDVTMRQSSPVVIAVLLFVFIALPLFVASVGPAIWCRDRDIISQETLITIYWPVGIAIELPFVGRPLNWYCNLWNTPKELPVAS